MKAIDILLLVAVGVVIGFAVWRVIRTKRKGKSACGCDCGSCQCGCGKK